MLLENEDKREDAIHRLTNAIEVFRELDIELNGQAMQILLLTAAEHTKALQIPDKKSQEYFDAFLTVRSIARILNITTASASRNVAALTDKPRGSRPPLGLITRPEESRHPFNSSKRCLFLTDKGWKAVEKILLCFDQKIIPRDLSLEWSNANDKRKGNDPQKDTRETAEEARRRLREEARTKDLQIQKLEESQEKLRKQMAEFQVMMDSMKGGVGDVKVKTTSSGKSQFQEDVEEKIRADLRKYDDIDLDAYDDSKKTEPSWTTVLETLKRTGFRTTWKFTQAKEWRSRLSEREMEDLRKIGARVLSKYGKNFKKDEWDDLITHDLYADKRSSSSQKVVTGTAKKKTAKPGASKS